MRLGYRVLCVSVLAVSAASAPMPAWAGFEWVAPREDAVQGGDLPAPQPGMPRISPQPLNGAAGLDPLPPLSVDQENGTRATVYSPEPAPLAAPAAAAAAPASPMSPEGAVEPVPRLKTLHRGSAPSAAGAAAGINNGLRQLRMADKLVMPTDEEAGIAPPSPALPDAEGRVAINPAPLQATAPAQPAFSAAPPQQPAAAPSMPVADAGPVLQGFGSDIPLVLALQQIVPPDYTYSFSGGINPGASVSWEGGKDWPEVLNEMLGSKGLSASIAGRSIQIRTASSGSPRADAAPSLNSENRAEAMAATMPAAGEPVAAPEVQPVDKVAAVPPVYPAGSAAAKPASAAAPVTTQKLLGRISDSDGLQLKDVRETVQVQGSPEAAQAARQSVTEHALGLAGQPGASPIDNLASETLPSIKTTSYSVTKISRQVVDPKTEKTAADVPESLHRTSITDPGEAPSRQPGVQALNLRAADRQASASEKAEPQAMVVASAAPAPEKQKGPSVVSPAVPPMLGAEEQRQKLEDMARQQGVVLDAKSYSQEVLGKIFNNGIVPAAGEAAPEAPSPVSAAAPVSLIPAREEVSPAPLKAVAPSAAPVPPPQGDPQFWEASRGADLQTTLQAWSQQSGVALVWKAARPYAVGSHIMVHGGFNDAIKTLFADGTKSGAFPVIRLNDGGAALGTLIVEDRS